MPLTATRSWPRWIGSGWRTPDCVHSSASTNGSQTGTRAPGHRCCYPRFGRHRQSTTRRRTPPSWPCTRRCSGRDRMSRDPLGEQDHGEVGMVPGDQGRMVAATDLTGLPPANRGGLCLAPSGWCERRHLPAPARRHLHVARERLRQGHLGPGCALTSMPAMPTACPLRSSVPGPATAATSGCSSTARSLPRRRVRWARRCCVRRWRLGSSSTCPATTGSSRRRTSCPRPGSAT